MATNIKVAGGLVPGVVNTPLDARSRVATEEDIWNIENPALGGLVFCTGTGKFYIITALKSKQIGALEVENAAVAKYQKFSFEAGAGNISITPQAFAVGFHNIAGGTPYRVTGYGADTRTITLSLPAGESLPDGIAAGSPVFLHTSRNDDASPQTATVESVDAEAGTVVLASALTLPATVTELGAADDPAFLVFPVSSWDADESSATAGDYNLNAGIGAAVVGSICTSVANYSFVCGLWNVNAGEASLVTGSGNLCLGDCADVGGSNNKLIAESGYGRYTFLRGNGNTATSDNIVVFGTGNYVTGMGTVIIGGGCGSEAEPVSGRDAFGVGQRLVLTGSRSRALGYEISVAADDALVVGKYGELAGSPENYGAFGIAGGEHDAPVLSFLHRVNRKVENPLFNPDDLAEGSSLSDVNPVDNSGERKFLAEQAFSTEYRGHLLPVTLNVSKSGTVTLDHDQYARWNLTASGTITLALANWQDGDIGEIVINTSKQTINIPAGWVTLGADITSTPGVYVLEIAQIGSTVFYAIKWPNSGGGGGTGGSSGEWFTVTYSSTVVLLAANGPRQRITLTGDATINAVANVDEPALLLEIIPSGTNRMVTLGNEQYTLSIGKTYHVGWMYNGKKTLRYPIVEMA